MDKIQRLEEVIDAVLWGLEGQLFAWGQGQRLAWVPLLKKHGITLVTKTQIEKQKLQVPKNPIGYGYFGAPIKRHAELYVLEIQCQPPKQASAAKQKLQRLHILLNEIISGLNGTQFHWNKGQQVACSRLLKQHNITLVTKTKVAKQMPQLKLKRGAKPVGFVGKTALYVLEVQWTKPKPHEGCWQFLDCQIMTGFPPEKCPNFKACKENARLSRNRSCKIPYTYQIWNPEFDGLFDHEEAWLCVDSDIPEEAIAAGWYPAERLFYQYFNSTELHHQCLAITLTVPQEAIELGFAAPERLQYNYYTHSSYSELIVSNWHSSIVHFQELLEAGWHPAINLPYYCTTSYQAPHTPVTVVLFDVRNSHYIEAIAAGWYPGVDMRNRPTFVPEETRETRETRETEEAESKQKE